MKMASLGLRGKQNIRFVSTTDSDHDKAVAANLLQRDFTAAGPDQKWLADITYIATRELNGIISTWRPAKLPRSGCSTSMARKDLGP
jgi:transposase InsO family protein